MVTPGSLSECDSFNELNRECTSDEQLDLDLPQPLTWKPTKLPEKYEILAQFFDSLDSSIRLLRLNGSSPSFTNICPKIACLTDRRFTHRHLAQLKFILRDAIEIKRVLVLDERTSCMKPDLHVFINVDAVENDGKLKSESGNMHLRKVLRSRLADFSKSSPEVDEIPEELLPEPFNRKELETCIRDDKIAEGTEQVLNSNINNSLNMSLPLGTSHLPPSFRKCFSKKVIS